MDSDHTEKVLAIIQARMGSSRLPGKVLMDIAGAPMLARVVERLRQCRDIAQIIVATTTNPQDDILAETCKDLCIDVFRGSEENVLDRYVGALQAYPAELCVRITSDCPLIDPEVSGMIIRTFRETSPRPDYTSNKCPPSYPRGLDTEVFTKATLEEAYRRATERYQRAHVTPYIYEHPELFRVTNVSDSVDRSNWRWTVDEPADLEFVRQIFKRLGHGGLFTWREVIKLLEEEPELLTINRRVLQKTLREC